MLFFLIIGSGDESFRFPSSVSSSSITSSSIYSTSASPFSVSSSLVSLHLVTNSSLTSLTSYTIETTVSTSGHVSASYAPVQESLLITPSPSLSGKGESDKTVYVILAIGIFAVVLAVVAFISIIALMLQKRSYLPLCSWYKSKPQVSQPPIPLRERPNNSLPARVMLIHSTETKEKKLLEILTFLDHDLSLLQDEDGTQLFEICRYDTGTAMDHPSEWLEKNYKSCDYIICVVGKKFKREWNDEIRPNLPLVFAFHQLFNASFTSSSNPLDKLVIVLRNKSKDEKHIPSQYLRGKQIFEMDDIQGLSSYMLGRPRHVFASDSPV